MTQQELTDQVANAMIEGSEAVGPERRAFLNAAFLEHLGAEMAGDVPAIIATFSKEGGHLSFNGARYETPEALTTFHKNFGWDGHGLFSDINGEIVRMLYTYDSVIVEFFVRANVDVALGDAPAGRPVAFPMCTIYQFDKDGKLQSERAYADSGALLPQPILSL
jgi:hypothetical protein